MASFKFELTPEQRVAVQIFDVPIAMTAGAGSGKTRVLVERFLALVKRGIDPARILTVTFTNEAAEELRTRILQSLRDQEASPKTLEAVEDSPWIGTIHSFCYRIFEQYGSLLQQPKIETITDDFELVGLFSSHYDEWISSIPDTTFQGLLRYFSPIDLYEIAELLFLNHFHFQSTLGLLKSEDDLGNKMIRRLADLLGPVVLKLRSKLHAEGSYTFNDLESFAYRILSEFPSIESKLQKQFESVLIDEFQDTSKLQWQILGALIGSNWKKLFIVGDPKQSIYGFRHAEVSLFKEVSREIQEMGGVVQTLSFNYRTQKTLLNHVNEASGRLFDLSVVPFHEMKPGRSDSGNEITIVQYAGDADATRQAWQDMEREAIVKAVDERVRSGEAPETIALLFRNADRMKEYSDSIEVHGHKTYTEITTPLFETYDILDLVHYLEAVEDPLNEYSLSAFLFSPYIQLPARRFHELSQRKAREKTSLFQILMAVPDERYDWFVKWILSGKTGTQATLEALFESTHKFPSFYKGLLTLLRPVLQMESLTKAVDAFRLWEKRGVLVRRTLGHKNGGIRLMTVHSAKGLEFPHVFLADCLRQPPHRQPPLLMVPGHPTGLKFRTDDGFGFSESYESIWAHLRSRDEEEAKRILYVAMTRARESLGVFLPKGMKTVPKGSWAALLTDKLIQGKLWAASEGPSVSAH